MDSRNDDIVKYILNIVLIFTIVIAARAFVVSLSDTRETGGVDLRNRVVGARVMLEGMDPYHFKWSEEYPESLLDPLDNPFGSVSRVSVPPTVLMLHAPLANVTYSVQRYLWFLAQWAFLLLSIFLFANCAGSRNKAKAIWCVGLFLAATHMWLFHLERGQIYILYVFLIALSYWLCRHPQRSLSFLGGAALGLAASLRPTLAILVLPPLIFRRRSLAAGMITGLLMSIIFCTAPFGTSIWGYYLSAMPHHEKVNLGEERNDCLAYTDMETIEGMDNLSFALRSPESNSSIQYLLKKFFKITLSSTVLFLLMALFLAFASFYLFKFRKCGISITILFLVGMVMFLVSEYFLPAVRGSYMEVMWVVPLSLILIASDNFAVMDKRKLASSLFFLFIGIFFTTVLIWNTYCVIIGDFSMTIFFILMAYLLFSSQAHAGEGRSPSWDNGGVTTAEDDES